jgi:hypothetical protein
MDSSETFSGDLKTIPEDLEIDISEVEELRVCNIPLLSTDFIYTKIGCVSCRKSDEELLGWFTEVFGDPKLWQLKKLTHQLNKKPS